jgi:hypothetical protein
MSRLIRFVIVNRRWESRLGKTRIAGYFWINQFLSTDRLFSDEMRMLILNRWFLASVLWLCIFSFNLQFVTLNGIV